MLLWGAQHKTKCRVPYADLIQDFMRVTPEQGPKHGILQARHRLTAVLHSQEAGLAIVHRLTNPSSPDRGFLKNLCISKDDSSLQNPENQLNDQKNTPNKPNLKVAALVST